jgi:hypothetical protein
LLCADRLQFAIGPEKASRSCCHIVPLRRVIPVEIAAVEITAVFAFDRIIMIGIIILLTDFVTAVDDRNTRLGQEECMQHDVKLDSLIPLEFVVLVLCCLNTAE